MRASPYNLGICFGVRPPQLEPDPAHGDPIESWVPRWPGERAERFADGTLLVGPSGCRADVYCLGRELPSGAFEAERAGTEHEMRVEMARRLEAA